MKFATLAGLLSLTVAGAAFATSIAPAPSNAPPPHGPGKMFEETDSNKDGSISKDEWRAKGDKLFNEIDTNHDGKISPDEMKAHHEQQREQFKEHREEWKARHNPEGVPGQAAAAPGNAQGAANPTGKPAGSK